MTSELSDQELISSVLEGNDDDYRHIVERYKSLLYTIAVRIVKNEEVAEEVAQDAFIKGFQSLKSFTGKSKLSTWLYRIAFNTAISFKRKARIEVTSLTDREFMVSSTEDTAESMYDEDRKRYVHQALQRLTAVDASVVTLFYLKEMSMEEISEITGLTISAIKVKLFRSRKKLAKDLQDHMALETDALL